MPCHVARRPADALGAYFRVDDIDAEHARLVAAAVRFMSDPHLVHRDDRSALWMAFFTDPDGHNLVLMQERPL